MKYYETHFEEYITKSQNNNLHPHLEEVFKKNFPNSFQNLKNIIFFGPSGIGKYTQMLQSIRKYSPSELKYEKKIIVNFNKQQYFFKISDIHFEIDVSLLGCNSKLLWHEIYLQILDAISAKADKTGIIVCKNFHEIHNELLENFYSYMQQNNINILQIKFILITEELSFLPDNILNCCQVISMARPKKTQYNKCLKNKLEVNLNKITNIKNLNSFNEEIMMPYKIICNKIIQFMTNINDFKFLKFREMLYDIFIYNLNINDCIWYILEELSKKELIKSENMKEIIKATYCFFEYFNNNYRPIYHLENYLFVLIKQIHKIE
jgi:hypothetical protein